MRFICLLLLCFASAWGQSQLPPFYQNSLDQLVYDFKNLTNSYGRYGSGCLFDANKCGLSNEEVTILQKIVQSQPEETKNTKFNIVNGSRYPQVFEQGGAPRIAATGNTRFAPVYFDVDRIVDLKTGALLPMAQMISLLVHEMGHHEGVDDTQERILDRIGNAVAQNFKMNTMAIDLKALGLPHIRAEFHNLMDFEKLKSVPDRSLRQAEAGVAFGNGTVFYDFDLPRQIVIRFAKRCDSEDHVQLIHFSNLRWWNPPSVPKEGERVNLISRIKVMCGEDIKTAETYEATFLMFAELMKKNSQWILNEGRTGYDIVSHDGTEERLEASLTPLVTNTQTLSNGGVWNGTTTATLSQDLEVTGCDAAFAANHFYKHLTNDFHTELTSSCVVKKTNEGKYFIEFNHTFPQKTFPAFYYIQSIVLKFSARAELILHPPLRTGVTISTTGYLKPEVRTTQFVDESGRIYSATGMDGFKLGQKYGVLLWLKNVGKLHNFNFAIRGVDLQDEPFHNLIPLNKANGLPNPNVDAGTRRDPNETYLQIFYLPNEHENIQTLKWMGFHYLDLIDENYSVIRVEFPLSYQVRP